MKSLPNEMYGVQLTKHGDLDALTFNENIPLPTLSDNDVLIEVRAAGVNNTDLNTRKGWLFQRRQQCRRCWMGRQCVKPTSNSRRRRMWLYYRCG